jgi:hypothetical protein
VRQRHPRAPVFAHHLGHAAIQAPRHEPARRHPLSTQMLRSQCETLSSRAASVGGVDETDLELPRRRLAIRPGLAVCSVEPEHVARRAAPTTVSAHRRRPAARRVVVAAHRRGEGERPCSYGGVRRGRGQPFTTSAAATPGRHRPVHHQRSGMSLCAIYDPRSREVSSRCGRSHWARTGSGHDGTHAADACECPS